MKNPIIKLENIEFYYGDSSSFYFDLNFDPCEVVAITGINGSGKTTLLQLISGFLRPDAGSIFIQDQLANSLEPHERGVGILFSKYNLFHHLTIHDNLMLSINPKGRRLKSNDKIFLDSLLDMLQIGPLKWKKPSELSDGQMQRAGIARCLSQEKTIFLMDEPFSAIDAETRPQLMKRIIRFVQDRNATLLFVTHNLYEIRDLVDKVLILEHGKIRYHGPPDRLEEPFMKEVLVSEASSYGPLSPF